MTGTFFAEFDLASLAIATLGHILINPGLLQWV